MTAPPKGHFTFDHTLDSQFNKPLSDLLEETKQTSPQTTALGVGGIIFSTHASHENDPHILLIRRAASERAFPTAWEIPGGGAEIARDATLLHSVVREVKEETGLNVIYIPSLVDYIEFKGSTTNMWKKFNFVVLVEDQVNIQLEPNEHDDWRWVNEEEFVRENKEGGSLSNVMNLQRKTILLAFKERRNLADTKIEKTQAGNTKM